MVKHTKTIRRHQPTNCLRVFDHFVELALKWLKAETYLDRSQTYKVVFFAKIFNGFQSLLKKFQLKCVPGFWINFCQSQQ